jgi:hypothetical protein
MICFLHTRRAQNRYLISWGRPKRINSKLYETDHYVPINEIIKETLAWLDKYLGPVNK